MFNSELYRQASFITERIWEKVVENAGEPSLHSIFPREMKSLILYGLELPLIEVENLTVHSAHQYLCALSGEKAKLTKYDRGLFGLLHIGPPANVIFLRKSLSVQVTNYVLAHEVGHFFADIFLLKNLWKQSLLEQELAIESAFLWQGLDGLLDLQTAIKGLSPRPTPIIGRDADLTSETSSREILADLIAHELLAPLNETQKSFVPDRELMTKLLWEKYSLPKRIAIDYYQGLFRYLNPSPDIVERLFGPILNKSQK